MSAALRSELPSPRLTIAESLDWADTVEGRWQLRDGVPEPMAPPSHPHGRIQAELAYRLTSHFRATGRPCLAATGVGVIPRFRSDRTALIPDVTVTCGGPAKERFAPDPIMLAEILSPSNETRSRANALAYTTIPSAREILLVSSTAVAAELFRRQADGNWPGVPEFLTADAMLRLDSLDFMMPLRELYVETALVDPVVRTEDHLRNIGKSWTSILDAELREAWANHPDLDELASRFGRTSGGIRSRLVRLGLSEP